MHRVTLRAALGLALCLVLGPAVLLAQASAEKILINTNRQGVAIQGYDPVGFFVDQKAVKGDRKYKAEYHGGIYYFASAEHQAEFERDPAKYEPHFGGFCAWAVSRGYTAKIDISTWQVVNGRLFFNYSPGIQKKFNQDQAGNLAKADQNWPELVSEQGRRVEAD